MRYFALPFAFLSIAILLFSCSPYKKDYEDKAEKLAHDNIIVDGHIDLPYWLTEHKDKDVSGHIDDGDFDYERAKNGGLNAPFMSIYVPARYQETGDAMNFADSLISSVQKLTTDYPDKFAVATSPQEIQKQNEDGVISLPMGLENGAPIGHDLGNIKKLYDKGIRYITLTHSKDNQLGDSSYDTANTHGGLSSFGEEVVKEMNRVGIMVDVSHVSDSTFYDILNTTKAPVIASHSSARYFTPKFERNLSDTMITVLAKNNGVMMINFGSNFISDSSRATSDSLYAHLQRWMKEHNKEKSDPETQEYIKEYRAQNYHYATVEDVADHIDHVANLVGIDYVGLGSDFDGVGDTLPVGLKDVSDYPNLIQELLHRGYTEDDIRKICYENIFRVWNDVAATAERLSNKKQEQSDHSE